MTDKVTALAKHEEPQANNITPMVAMIERVAMDPTIPIDRLEQMLAMKERMDAKEAEMAFAAAFARMQSALPVIAERGAIKNRDKEIQSTYPLWEDVNAALRQPLADNGLSMSFDRRKEDGKTIIGCVVTHKMGHSRRAEIDLPRDDSGSKNAVQGEGSTVSYGQRYASKMLINWISEGTEDDNGVKAGRADTITADQYEELSALIEETKADEPQFLKYMGVRSLEDIPAAKFANAISALNAKKRQKGAK